MNGCIVTYSGLKTNKQRNKQTKREPFQTPVSRLNFCVRITPPRILPKRRALRHQRMDTGCLLDSIPYTCTYVITPCRGFPMINWWVRFFPEAKSQPQRSRVTQPNSAECSSSNVFPVPRFLCLFRGGGPHQRTGHWAQLPETKRRETDGTIWNSNPQVLHPLPPPPLPRP